MLGMGTGRRSGDGNGEGEPAFDPRAGGGGGGGLLALTFKSEKEPDERRCCESLAWAVSAPETARLRG